MTELEKAKQAVQRSEDRGWSHSPHVFKSEIVELRNAIRHLIKEIERGNATIEQLRARPGQEIE
jgi:DNA polymerase sigma